MPFAESIIDETNRILAFSPLLMHKATQDVELSGYRIPKDTWVRHVTCIIVPAVWLVVFGLVTIFVNTCCVNIKV